ncbi:hypothetical protein [Frondihabitans australicus]|uniref:Protein-tyrosine phosphatase n=1 Tax=Frondihabitans australicus TaxID=386892 RepID=A0A495IJI4_9MICO|nr:hypothetical protein [Frondihabitans australicus]RKR76127.1 protein-tyrosine phosphatase [Frondihabitans australicus]
MTTGRPAGVLFVCTGNLCRSPLAEASSRARGDTRGVLTFASAGTRADDGHPAAAQSEAAARRIGLSLAGHATRRLTNRSAAAADLVLTMSFDQRRQVVQLAPAATRRTFTLPEFARLIRFSTSAGVPVADSVQALVSVTSSLRGLVPALPDPESDEVPDPFGRSDAAFDQAIDRIESALAVTIPALVSAARARPRIPLSESRAS